jgi:predicted ester cyclase
MNETYAARRRFLKFLLATPFAFLKPLFAAPTAVERKIVLSNEQIAHAAFDAYMNQGDGSGFESHGFSLGVPASDPFLHSVGFSGHLGAKRAAYIKGFPDLKVTILSSSEQGGVVTLKWRADGTQRGAIGSLPASGKRASVPGSSQITFVYGKITKFVSSFDHNDLRTQLGAARVG